MLARAFIVTLIVACFAVIAFLATNSGLEAGITQALIAGLIIVSGWFVTFVIQDWTRSRERNEIQTDIQLALRAEIQDCHETYTWRDRDTRAFGQQVQQKMRAAGDGASAFHPFIVRDAKMIVFDAMKDRLHHLPAAVVDEVIQFYCQQADLQAFADQMMQPAFQQLECDRRAKAYGHYIKMTVECENRAQDALTKLNYSLGVWDDAGSVNELAKHQAQLDDARKSLRRWISKTDRVLAGQSTDEVL